MVHQQSHITPEEDRNKAQLPLAQKIFYLRICNMALHLWARFLQNQLELANDLLQEFKTIQIQFSELILGHNCSEQPERSVLTQIQSPYPNRTRTTVQGHIRAGARFMIMLQDRPCNRIHAYPQLASKFYLECTRKLGQN
jgi:hypothetical protein